MTTLKLISKKGSKSAKAIRTDAGIGIYKGNKAGKIDAVINYGLAGTKLDAFKKMWPSVSGLPMVNRQIGHSKYSVCQQAARNDIPVPESCLNLGSSATTGEWIEKRVRSIGGLGIKKATKKASITGKYYQKFIDNRRYELRVHAFLWIPEEEWHVQKRVGDPKEIAWNYKNGGHFITVKNPRSYGTFKEAVRVSKKVLDMLGMAFGAVDFLVTADYKLYFIEINSAPGFSELSQPIYVDAFSRLKKLNSKELKKIAR